MIKVCYCADDFAMNPHISNAILLLLQQDALHATSCMTQSNDWNIAAEQLKPLAHRIQIGLHLNFTHPFNTQIPTYSLSTLMLRAWTGCLNHDLIRSSIQQQWINFISTMGRPPDFIDGHQHVHQFPIIREILLDVLQQQQFQGWVRNLQYPILLPQYAMKTRLLSMLGATSLQQLCKKYEIKQNIYFAGIYDFNHIDYARLNQQWLKYAKDGLLIMCHPALPSHSQLSEYQDSIATARIREFQYLSSSQFKQDCRNHHIFLSPMDIIR